MDVWVLEEHFHDGVVVNGPDFEGRIHLHDRGGGGSRRSKLDQAGERNGRWIDIAFLFVRFDFSSQIQGHRRLAGLSGGNYGRYTFVIAVTGIRVR